MFFVVGLCIHEVLSVLGLKQHMARAYTAAFGQRIADSAKKHRQVWMWGWG